MYELKLKYGFDKKITKHYFERDFCQVYLWDSKNFQNINVCIRFHFGKVFLLYLKFDFLGGAQVILLVAMILPNGNNKGINFILHDFLLPHRWFQVRWFWNLSEEKSSRNFNNILNFQFLMGFLEKFKKKKKKKDIDWIDINRASLTFHTI